MNTLYQILDSLTTDKISEIFISNELCNYKRGGYCLLSSIVNTVICNIDKSNHINRIDKKDLALKIVDIFITRINIYGIDSNINKLIMEQYKKSCQDDFKILMDKDE